MTTRTLKWTLLCLLANLIINLSMGCGATGAGETKKAAAAAVTARVPVDGAIVKSGDLKEQMQISGTLSANQEVSIMSELSRKVVAVYAKEGGQVQQGTLLFKLDDADLLAELEQYEQQAKLARINEQRLKDLIAHEAALQQDYDQAFTNLRVIEAQIRQIQVSIAKTYLRAPFGGKVGLVNIHPGALVIPGQSLATLEDKSRIKVDFYIPEKYSTNFKAGDTISFGVESNNNIYQAVISAEESKLSSETRTLLIRAIVHNADGQLIPGESAKVTVNLSDSKNAMMIPSKVLLPSATGYSVYVARAGNAQLQAVQTGERNASNIHIVSGLKDGDTLITSNMLRLTPGAPLQFVSVK